jgi:hypothetical protein
VPKVRPRRWVKMVGDDGEQTTKKWEADNLATGKLDGVTDWERQSKKALSALSNSLMLGKS